MDVTKRERYIRELENVLRHENMSICHEAFFTEGAIKEILELLKEEPEQKKGRWPIFFVSDSDVPDRNVGNLVNRQDAIDTALQFFVEFFGGAFRENDQRLLMKRMNELPSAGSERKKGYWKKVHGYSTPGGDPVWCCSECGKGRHVYGIEHGSYGADVSDGQWKSCPNCDTYMGEE